MLGSVLVALLSVSSPGLADAPLDSPMQAMALPAELRERVQDYVLAGAPSQRTRFNRLLHLLFDKDGLGLTYQDDATLSVTQSYAQRTTNCLSFTLLFVALAREAGLDAVPQEFRETLGWHQDSGIFYRVDHINAVVHIGHSSYVVDIAGDSFITLRDPVPVSDHRLLAHYFNNLAMRDLELGRIAPAMQEMTTVLDLDPGYATNWSNAGVLYLRNDDRAAAEKAYTKALTLEPANASALANMANLAQIEGDNQRAAELRQRLQSQQQSDPFFHFLQAVEDEQAGDYAHAIDHYRLAIRLHDDEPRFYAALSHAYDLQGDTRQAIRALDRAEWLSTGTARDGYRKQLDDLRQRQQTQSGSRSQAVSGQ
jgi:Flp pilus assembly protein TadD